MNDAIARAVEAIRREPETHERMNGYYYRPISAHSLGVFGAADIPDGVRLEIPNTTGYAYVIVPDWMVRP